MLKVARAVTDDRSIHFADQREAPRARLGFSGRHLSNHFKGAYACTCTRCDLTGVFPRGTPQAPHLRARAGAQITVSSKVDITHSHDVIRVMPKLAVFL